MNRVAVVSACFLIDVDQIDEMPKEFDKIEEFDYILFTNDKSKMQCSSHWDIREIDCTKFKNGLLATKHVKWLTHEYLPDYDVIIWVDSFIVPNKNVKDEILELVDQVLLNESVFYIRKQCFKTVYEDIQWCIKNKRISESMANDVIEYLQTHEHFSVFETSNTYWSSGMIKNNKCQAVKYMSHELYLLIESVGYRDQHWLPRLFKKYAVDARCTKRHLLGIKRGLASNIFLHIGKQFGGNHNYAEKYI